MWYIILSSKHTKLFRKTLQSYLFTEATFFFLKSLTNLQSFENLCALRYFKRGTFVNHLVMVQYNINSRISLKLLQILKYLPESLTVLQRTLPALVGAYTSHSVHMHHLLLTLV